MGRRSLRQPRRRETNVAQLNQARGVTEGALTVFGDSNTHAQSRVGLRHGPFFIRRTQLRFLRRLRPSVVRALGNAPSG